MKRPVVDLVVQRVRFPIQAAPWVLQARHAVSTSMTDLLHVVPDLDVSLYSHILPSLERALISSTDLLTLDVLDIAKRAHVPLAEVRRLADEVLRELHAQLHVERSPPADKTSDSAGNNVAHGSNKHDSSLRISTLDPGLDLALGGGFCPGRVSEVTGERYGLHTP